MSDNLTVINNVFDMIEKARNVQYGVMIRSTFKNTNNQTHAHMNDTTHFTEQQALDEAMTMKDNDLMGLFEINMVTGDLRQIMNRFQLIDYCDHRRWNEVDPKEKAEQKRIDNYNFLHGTTL
jgi:hypothetical protein